MLRHAFAAAALAAAVSLSACSQVPQTAEREQTLSLTGVVQAIDRDARRVVVRGEDRTVQYRVGRQVRNFDQIEVGDQVTLDYLERVAVAMADPEDAGEPVTDIFGVRAPEGARPGAAGISVSSVVVEFLGYDAVEHRASIRWPDGTEQSVLVPEELRRFAATRATGDRILVLVEQAMVVAVTAGA